VHGVDDLLRRQVDRMQERMLDAPGMGLAATQFGLLRRLLVFSKSPESEVDVLVNPSSGAARSPRCSSSRAIDSRKPPDGDGVPLR
jgi:peptide deformylase